MPATGLLALLDDVTTILDDVAVMSKVAAQKTAGLAGDDLAVNAEGLVGLAPSRELPIIGKVALGSLANKFVLVPLALALPMKAISPLLMLGGTFLCYEGVHKVWHKLGHHDDHHDEVHTNNLKEALKETSPEAMMAEVERKKVRQAIITDIVLSAEIVAVALGALAEQEFMLRALSLSLVALAMTVGIYGLVAVIVKLDDIGLALKERGGGAEKAGDFILASMPYLMRTLSVFGTLAMFLVGGGIIAHGFHLDAHHLLHDYHLAEWLVWTIDHVGPGLLGVVVGIIAVVVVEGIKKVVNSMRGTPPSAGSETEAH